MKSGQIIYSDIIDGKIYEWRYSSHGIVDLYIDNIYDRCGHFLDIGRKR